MSKNCWNVTVSLLIPRTPCYCEQNEKRERERERERNKKREREREGEGADRMDPDRFRDYVGLGITKF